MPLEELAQAMADREISFSIFAPRKMSFLFKMFEKAGGDLQMALSKKYAKDPRHLILLNGFQLQERPASPQHTIGAGQKRSHSPSPTRPSPNTHPSPTQITSIRGQVPPPPPPPFSRPAAPDPKPRGASPAPRPNWSVSGIPSPVPSPQPPPPSALAMQLSQRSNVSAPSNPLASLPTIPTQLSMTPSSLQTSTIPRASGINRSAMNVPRPGPPSLMTGPVPVAPRMTIPNPNVQQSAIQSGGPNSGMVNPQMSNVQTLNPQMSNTQMANPQMLNPSMPNQMLNPQMQAQNMGQQQISVNQSTPMMSMGQPVMSEVSSAGVMSQAAKRSIVWQGHLDYLEKVPTAPGQAVGNMKYTLACHISSNVIQGVPEILTEDWPKTLTIQLLPRTLISTLTPIFKNSSIHVGLHFPMIHQSRYKGDRN